MERYLKALGLIAVLLAVLLHIVGMSVVHAQNDSETLPEDMALPTTWQGPAQVTISDVQSTLPPFEVIASEGEFLFSRVDEDGHVRILPAPGTDDNQALILAWRVSEDVLETMAGNIAVVSLDARTYSNPDGVLLQISEGEGVDRSFSNMILDDIDWQHYSVAREITSQPDSVQIGFDWAVPAEPSWIEFRDMTVSIQPADAFTGTLVPTRVLPTPVPTRTPYVVTSTPQPANVFAAATQVADATTNALQIGTATPTPDNMVTATFTPSPTATPTPIVIVNTPTPENDATATAHALQATAIAFTTGTPTPMPPNAFVATATSTPTPKKAPTKTPTPLFVLLENIVPTKTPAPTPVFPEELVGKILFKATFKGTERKPDYMIMNADGSDVGRMTGGYWYNRAVERDRYSSNRQYYASVAKEQDGFRRLQIFYDVPEFGTKHQLTFFGAGKAWDPAWSPTDDVVVMVSNESANDEIWVVRRGEWPATQLTNNEWEWDKHPSFSPDGSQIIFSSNRGDGRTQIWVMDADGSSPRRLIDLPFEAWDPVWVKYPDS